MIMLLFLMIWIHILNFTPFSYLQNDNNLFITNMKKNEIYRLCLKAGTFNITPIFKITVGKFSKTINTFFLPAPDKQRYNYDLYFQRSKEPEIIFEVFAGNSLVGAGKLKIDGSKAEMPNESVEILDKKQKVGVIECSLRKIEKKTKKPAMKIRIIQASYSQELQILKTKNPLVIVKYGDNNYNTDEGEGMTPVWKKEFNIGTADNDRIFLESWAKEGEEHDFIGVSIIDIANRLGGEFQVEVTRDKSKQGMLKYELLEHTSKRPDKGEQQINDKNYLKPRNIKTFIEQAPMKEKIGQGFIQLESGGNKYNTDKIIPQGNEIKCNQSLWVKGVPGEDLVARVIKIENDIEETVGSCTIKVDDIKNKKELLALVDEQGNPKGHIILEFNDDELDIKEQINASDSEKKISEEKEKASISPETSQKISEKNQEIKNRYANRQSIHDYMADVNAVLQQGLLTIAKERPEDPIKHLGLFLINYKK